MKKILILEDEELIADLLDKRLSNEGFTVLLSDDIQKSLQMISQEVVDLIILDLDIVGNNAFKFLSKKQNDAKLKKIPVLVISNSGQVGELSRARELGATDWVLKTEFDPREVVQKVKDIFKSIKATS